MPASEVGTTWSVVTPDHDAVPAALCREQCDGIIPAASELLDGFVRSLDKLGVLALLQPLPDPRERRSIAVGFFASIVIHRALFRIPTLSAVGRVLFRSPDVLRKLGSNFRQIHEGFYVGSAQRPFNEEALADFFAEVETQALLQHQAKLSAHLLRQRPELLEEGVALLDCITVTVPPGHRGRAGLQYKVAVLGLWHGGQLFPLLWHFAVCGPGQESDLGQGKLLVETARRAWGEGALRRLIVDRGFIGGAWLGELHEQGIGAVIGVRSDMDIYEDMIGLSQLQDAVWLHVEPPKLHYKPLPEHSICLLTDLQSWSSCPLPLHGVVIRDDYPDRTVWQCVVSTDDALKDGQAYLALRQRWAIEESFMDLTRYWNLEHFGSCRPLVAAAQTHFTLLAYSLLHLYTQDCDRQLRQCPPPILAPQKEITVYWGSRYAILDPSQLVAIIFGHFEAWSANRDTILAALRFAEGLFPPPRAPD